MSSELLIGIMDACKRVGIGRSYMYDLLDCGEIASVKVGKRRLVVAESLQTWVANLPAAQVKGA